MTKERAFLAIFESATQAMALVQEEADNRGIPVEDVCAELAAKVGPGLGELVSRARTQKLRKSSFIALFNSKAIQQVIDEHDLEDVFAREDSPG